MQTQARITVYCILCNMQLIKRIEALSTEVFEIVFLESVQEACELSDDNSVILVEKGIFNDIPAEDVAAFHNSIIVVSDVQLNLQDEIINKVPRELFLTPYLDEFIFWTVEKAKHLHDLRQTKKRKQRVEELISELHSLSRCSIVQAE